MNALELVKEELKNSTNIEKTSTGFVVWDDYGMIISTHDTIENAASALFAHSYGS